jgi:hypothetical protein
MCTAEILGYCIVFSAHTELYSNQWFISCEQDIATARLPEHKMSSRSRSARLRSQLAPGLVIVRGSLQIGVRIQSRGKLSLSGSNGQLSKAQ